MEVRIEVAAAAINFPDVLFTAGAHQVKPTPPSIPGFEVAGVVVESREPSLAPGARVAATLPGSGGYATRAITGPRTTYALPDALDVVLDLQMPVPPEVTEHPPDGVL